MLSHDQEVSDGEVHTVMLEISDRTANLSVDGSPSSKDYVDPLPDPVGLEMISLTLGTPEEAVNIPGSSEELKGMILPMKFAMNVQNKHKWCSAEQRSTNMHNTYCILRQNYFNTVP